MQRNSESNRVIDPEAKVFKLVVFFDQTFFMSCKIMKGNCIL